MENIPGIVLRPQSVVVEGSEGGVGRWGGEVNKIKKAIMRPQHIPYNYVPKFNQNSFPHWAVHSSQAPLSGSASQDRPLRCGRLQNLLAAQSRAGSIHHRSPSPCLSRAWGLDHVSRAALPPPPFPTPPGHLPSASHPCKPSPLPPALAGDPPHGSGTSCGQGLPHAGPFMLPRRWLLS